MNKLPFARRLRGLPSGVLAPFAIRRPFRLWMTGSLAVVMAATRALSGWVSDAISVSNPRPSRMLGSAAAHAQNPPAVAPKVLRYAFRVAETVDGVGEIRAKDIREGLRRQQESNLVDRYLQT